MADAAAGPTGRARRRAGRAESTRGLWRRLVVGSLAVALVSIALLAVVTLVVTDADLGSAGREQETATTNVLLQALRTTYVASGGWHAPQLSGVAALARTSGFGLELRSGGRKLLDIQAAQAEGRSHTTAVVVSGRQVGVATVQYPASGLSLADAKLRRTIATSVAAASVLAALVALLAAVIGARALVAPVRLLTVATRRLGNGDLTSRVGAVEAPREIQELARAFDFMAAHLQREDALRRAIVADLAHELRTPLAVLQAELEALAVGVEEFTQSAVSSLGEEVNRLSRLVEDLEVLAAAQAAGLSLRREPTDLAAVARSASGRLESRFAERGVDLRAVLQPVTVLADPGRVEQMMVNLLSNAAKFTPPGGSVLIAVERTGTSGRIVVADTGIGIPPAEQAMVFDRFFRGQSARGSPGSGVGLAVVAELVTVHGGHVELQSTLGSGTTVTISLPLA